MAKSTVDLIREAENNAISIENKAKIQAEKIVADAELQGKDLIKNKVNSANTDADKKIKQAEEESAKMIIEAKKLAKTETDKLIEDALTKEQDVYNKILSIII